MTSVSKFQHTRLWSAVPAYVLGFVFVFFLQHAVDAQDLTLKIVGLRSEEGLLHIGFYESAESWESEKSNFQRHGDKSTYADGTVILTFSDIPPGHYSAALVDDENYSGGMDWGIFLPKEGFAFSNYEHRGLFRPDFEDFDFELRENQPLTIVMRVRYL